MKKIVPPIIITIIIIAYFLLYISGAVHIPGPLWFMALGIIIPIALICVSIFVLIERIKEIRSGEEDDLGKY